MNPLSLPVWTIAQIGLLLFLVVYAVVLEIRVSALEGKVAALLDYRKIRSQIQEAVTPPVKDGPESDFEKQSRTLRRQLVDLAGDVMKAALGASDWALSDPEGARALVSHLQSLADDVNATLREWQDLASEKD